MVQETGLLSFTYEKEQLNFLIETFLSPISTIHDNSDDCVFQVVDDAH